MAIDLATAEERMKFKRKWECAEMASIFAWQACKLIAQNQLLIWTKLLVTSI